MDTVAIVARAAEASELVDDPDGGLGGVLLGGPGGDGTVEILDLGVKVAESEGDDLSNLVVSDL